jgi:hypothetical protein
LGLAIGILDLNMQSLVIIQSSPTGLTPQRNSKDRVAGQPTPISYKMTKKRLCTQSGFAKKRNPEQNLLLKKAQTHEKSNFGRHPMLRFYKKHQLGYQVVSHK